MAYHRYHKLDTRIARIFNTYGPRMRKDDGRAIPNFINQALRNRPVTIYGTGRQTRSFCYISDLASGIYRLLMSGEHVPMNIGNPDEMTLLKLTKTVLKLTGSRSRIVYKSLPVDDPKVRCPDIRMAKKVLTWWPRVGIEEGLKRTIQFLNK